MNDNKIFEYLDNMQDAVSNASVFIKGMSREDFLADKRTQQAVIMNLILIAESAKQLVKVYPELIDLYPDIPWHNMLRVVEYMESGDFNHFPISAVWDVAQMELPNLLYKQLPDLRKGLTRRIKTDLHIHNYRPKNLKKHPGRRRFPFGFF